MIAALDVDVELSGGIRDDASLAAALATGARRVNIGTAALERPDWVARAIAEHGDRIAVGLDVRGDTLAARGWTRDGGDLWADAGPAGRGRLRAVRGDRHPPGRRDGRAEPGPLPAAVRGDRGPGVASGGVSSLADLRALAELAPLGVEGAIVGKALYAGAFTLPEALKAVGKPSGRPRPARRPGGARSERRGPGDPVPGRGRAGGW